MPVSRLRNGDSALGPATKPDRPGNTVNAVGVIAP